MFNLSTNRPQYVATDTPQAGGWNNAGEALDRHADDMMTYGPPPRCYDVIRRITTRDGQYGHWPTYQAPGAAKSLPYHPFSTIGRKKANPHIVSEFRDDRSRVVGFFQPPFEYIPDQWIWNYHSSWSGAIAGALTKMNVKKDPTIGQNWDSASIQSLYQSLTNDGSKPGKPEDSVLWHPSDRTTMVFEDEPACSIVARHLGYSVIVICPQVNADATGWNRIYNISNRPPVYARWSTGVQAHDPPLVLGCIPRQTYPNNIHQKVMWFFMTTKQPSIKNSMRGTMGNFSASSFGFPASQKQYFLWALVSLHRRIATGSIGVPDNYLGPWLQAFGQYLEKHSNVSPSGRPHFEFDSSKTAPYNGKSITFHQLTAFTMNPNFKEGQNSVFLHTKKWDTAINARIQYQLEKTDANWDAWVKSFAKVVQTKNGL